MIKTVVSILENFMSILILLAIIVLFGSVLFVGFSQGIWAALGVFFVGSISLVFICGLPCVLLDINNNIKELNMGSLSVSKANFQQRNISSRDKALIEKETNEIEDDQNEFFQAVADGDIVKIKAFLNAGVSPNLKNVLGNSLLKIARNRTPSEVSEEVIFLLREYGATEI